MTTLQICVLLIMAFVCGTIFGISVGISVSDYRHSPMETEECRAYGLIPGEKGYYISESRLLQIMEEAREDERHRMQVKYDECIRKVLDDDLK